MENQANDGGFVIRIDNCHFLGEDTEFSSNVASSCLSIVEASIEVYRCGFEQNVGRGISGGGSGESAIVQGCAFLDNRDECTAGVRLGGYMDPVIVERNLFVRNTSTGAPGCGGGALQVGLSQGRIAFNTFAFDSAADGGGGLVVRDCPSMEVAGNTFYGCDGPVGSAVVVSGTTSNAEFIGNIVSHSTGGPAAATQFGGVTGGCNDYWANEEGDFYNWVPDPTDLFEDPSFCDPQELDLTLEEGSPCVEGNTPGCSQIGALGIGCGVATAAEASLTVDSWSRIKGRYATER